MRFLRRFLESTEVTFWIMKTEGWDVTTLLNPVFLLWYWDFELWMCLIGVWDCCTVYIYFFFFGFACDTVFRILLKSINVTRFVIFTSFLHVKSSTQLSYPKRNHQEPLTSILVSSQRWIAPVIQPPILAPWRLFRPLKMDGLEDDVFLGGDDRWPILRGYC